MLNPAIVSKNIKDEFISYITTTFSFADKNLQEKLVDELNNIIAKGPYLETNDIFKTGLSMEQLINEDVLSPLFRELESRKPNNKLYKRCLPLDRPLYLHQEKAIRSIVSGYNVIISTGTGSGKTNCFLIPVINELLREKENNTLGPGVRALFIYPMNALANDQMKNIRQLLMKYPDITFGIYNGSAENDEETAINVYEAMFGSDPIPELRTRLENELLSRDEMKETPPNILFTNYAMLEHLLFRPKDDVLFSRADFKYVVLDEAHVYTGATGIETSMLLRRLQARISSTRKTQFILTSATLGNESNYDDVITFATNLCGVDFKKENIIRAIREKYNPSNNETHYNDDLINALADERNKVSNILESYGINCDKTKPESELLYDFVCTTDLYHNLRRNIVKITSINDVKSILDKDTDTTIAFISLCTRACKNGRSLIDARYHFFVRCLEGCFINLSPNKDLYLIRKNNVMINDISYKVFEISICDECGKLAIVGKIENQYLVHVNQFDENVNYFYFASEENDEIDNDIVDTRERFLLCPYCGSIVSTNKKGGLQCDCDKSAVIKIVKANVTDQGAKCGNCHVGNYKRFYLGYDAATSVLATSLYEELSEITYEDIDVNDEKSKNIFIKASVDKLKKERKKGRQFLVFSDSRQEAARFACYLSKSYKEFLRRRGICQILKEQGDYILTSIYTISDFVYKLTAYFSNKRTFAESNSDNSNLTIVSNRNAWVAMLNELARFSSPTSLTSLGVLQFSYLGNTSEVIDTVAKTYNVSTDAVSNLLNLLIFEIVKMGAICTDGDSDISDDDREYIFYSPSQKFVAPVQKSNDNKYLVTDWYLKNKNGDSKKFYRTNRLYYTTHYLKVSEEVAAEFLITYFEYLRSPDNPYCLIDKNKNGTYVLPAKYFQVKIAGDKSIKWYQCSKCGKVSQFQMNGCCTKVRCGSSVIEVEPISLQKNNHFAKLYFSDRMSPLFIKEHTAQLSKKESSLYQEQFIKKEINALSCSTTFEMGVDVGDLETVFLRNIPPTPSNYVQRAGRAGRSINVAAYALTYAKLSSHDLSFFNEPYRMINGIIFPPLFKIDNQKIARRHIYAIALSMFFADYPEQYNANDAKKFISEQGYKLFYEWLNSKPEKLKNMLIKSIPNVDDFHRRLGLLDYSWLEFFIGDEGVFTSLLKEYENNIKEFESIIRKLKKDDVEKAGRVERRLKNYKNNRLIEFLARGNILPRYGFPVDTVELEQNVTASNINKLRLSRDLQIAIAEYAPSSEVIADGKLYTSRYIKKSNFGTEKQDWFITYIGICPNKDCKTVNYSITPVTSEGIICSSCGRKIDKHHFYSSIEPRSGFATERESKEVPLTKQDKNYRSEDYYIGNIESKTIDKFTFKFNDANITIESTINDSLLIKSSNNFYVCPKCGFAYAADETISGDITAKKQIENGYHKIVTTKKHESLYGQYNCDCQELLKYSLHHTFNTDVAKISFDCDTSDYSTMVSTMYALLNAISNELNIERKDIKGCLSLKIVNFRHSYSIIIYDAVPGGAGHSRRLIDKDGSMFLRICLAALKKMKQCTCEPSCYSCLRSYENQKIHEQLNRKLAAKFLHSIIDNEDDISNDKNVDKTSEINDVLYVKV
jgi:ATP-dependent helicase YprA (DUF1998 family)